MSYLRDRVIVLKKEPFREHDRRYTMYGRDYGLLVAVARGASSHRSKQAGHLEPFGESEVMIAKGAAFDKLAVARLVRFPSVPHESAQLSCYAICGAFTDLIVRLTRPGMPDDRIFLLLQELIATTSGMTAVPSADRAHLLLSAATLRLLDVLGFAPPIERAPEGTTPVPGIALAAFMRRSSLADILCVTGRADVFQSASRFVEEALAQTPLEREPHGAATIRAVLRVIH